MRFVGSFCAVLICVNMAIAGSDFWSWFQETEQQFPSTEKFDTSFGNDLSSRLKAINPGLTYEISLPENGLKELVISSDGLPELIPDVENLVRTAPKLDGWKITAFRPRLENYAQFTLQFGDREFDPKKLWYYSRVEDGFFDLIIYHPIYSKDIRTELINGSYLLLDMAIGEYNVMTGIRYIDHQQLPEKPEKHGLSRFTELQRTFDNYKKKNWN